MVVHSSMTLKDLDKAIFEANEVRLVVSPVSTMMVNNGLKAICCGY